MTRTRRRTFGVLSVTLLAAVTGGAAAMALRGTTGSVGAVTTGPSPSSQAAPPIAAFVGDSYTAGVGASRNDERWSSVLSDAMGWREVNLAQGGTGYVTTAGIKGCGREVCGDYTTQADKLVGQNPDVIVVAGGQNDVPAFSRDPRGVTKKINALYSGLRSSHPQARIIAVGPSTPADRTASINGIDAAVRDSAKAVDAEYVSLLEPDVIKREFVLSDGAQVNDQGHAAIAQRVETALSQ